MKLKFTISLLTLCFVLLTGTSVWAQEKATIKGQISSDSGTADNISVTLKGTKIGTNTDTRGNYEIKNLKPGTYIVRVSAVGFTSKEKALRLTVETN